MTTAHALPQATRVGLRVSGQVQGVGFRPFVYRLARELALDGRVWNDAAGVCIEVRGAEADVAMFRRRLELDAPPLARIDRIEVDAVPPAVAPGPFRIDPSVGGRTTAAITPDVATCPDCLAELFEPGDRRHRYPFINCTQCGPRYTITDALPYDRPNTSMAAFTLCPRCAAEYADPGDRRFHAQPNACPACGPRVALCTPDGATVDADDPFVTTVARLREGAVVAVKGLGGYHLACAARDARAVAALRERKGREAKPFAVMAANLASLRGLAEVDAGARAVLEAPWRPIVLLPKAPGCDAALPGVAPGLGWLGALLPYTPVHWLLFHAAAGLPEGTAWLDAPQELLLVMTSANPGGEPLVTDDAEALARLGGIADLFLRHDRPIRVRCDDSVVRVRDGAPAFLRRSRGRVPRGIRLAHGGPSVLAVGGHLKNAVCVTRDDRAYLSQHVGDLDNAATCRALDEAVHHLCEVLEVTPERVVRDLHPDFYSSRFAEDYAAGQGIACATVQHHHAHVAAVAAEHGVTGELLGVALDGVGLGDDGGAWGGELLRVGPQGFQRLGHLAPLALPGGDRAAREPWRLAAAALHALGRGGEITTRFPGPAAAAVEQMLAAGTRCPPTTGAGRLFHAAAGLLGRQAVARYEGQAAMLLEGLAATVWPAPPWEAGYRIADDGVLDLLPALERLVGTDDPATAAARFHATLAAGLVAWVAQAAAATGLSTVALGGGCFLNELLCGVLRRELPERGLRVLEARRAPPGDGGLALGQAWAVLQAETTQGVMPCA
ncbi:MAG: carbamoyltransferase HypF [Gammaproteobacteria bacterium]|nr:carbamoyltransferase HypF [Gammaproteobacteria bacterium]